MPSPDTAAPPRADEPRDAAETPGEGAASPPARSWRPGGRVIEALVTAAFTLYVAWPFLFGEGYVMGYDSLAYTGPLTTASFDALGDGRLPQWNADLFGGTPHLANPQAGVLYPVKWLFVGAGPQRGVELLGALHLAVLAVGMFSLLAARLRLRPPAALVGTVAVVGSGALGARSIQFEQMSVIAWIPLLLVGIDAVLDRRSRPGLAVAGTAIVTALLLVAGHPQQVVIAVPVVAVWVLCRTIDRRQDDLRVGDHGWLGRVGAVVVAGVLGAGLAAVQLVPTALQLDNSANVGGRTLEAAAAPGLSATAGQLPGTILGSIFLDRTDLTANSFEAMAYVGAGVAVLALLGVGAALGVRTLRATATGLTVLAVTAVVLALGPQCEKTPADELVGCQSGGGLYRSLYQVVPGLNQERAPGRWMLVFVFAVAILAALAIDLAWQRRVTLRSLAPSAALGVLFVGTVLVIDGELPPTTDSRTFWAWVGAAVLVGIGVLVVERARAAPAATAGAVLVAAVVLVELAIPTSHSIARALSGAPSFTSLATASTDFLAEQPGRTFTLTDDRFDDFPYLIRGMRPNANGLFGVPAIDGYDGGIMVTDQWVDAMSAATVGRFQLEKPLRWQVGTPVDADLFARWGVRWMLVDETWAPTTEAWQGPVVDDGTFAVYENPAWRGDALVYRATTPGEGPFLAVELAGLDPDVAMVPPDTVDLRCTDDCTPTAAALTRTSPEAIDVRVDGGEGGLLVVTEQNQPGWTVTVDGEVADTVTVDGMNIGVVLGPGAHDVTLRYRTPGLRLGLAISTVSLIVVLAVATGAASALAARVRRRAPRPISSS